MRFIQLHYTVFWFESCSNGGGLIIIVVKLERCGCITAKAQVILLKSSSLLDSKWTCKETSVGRQLAFFILNRYVSSITQSEFALKRYSYVCIYLAFVLFTCKDFTQSVKPEASALIVFRIKYVNVKYHSSKILAQVERCQNYNVQTLMKLYYYYYCEMTSEFHSVNCSRKTDW